MGDCFHGLFHVPCLLTNPFLSDRARGAALECPDTGFH
jgi:hypothetical protein